MKRAASFRCKDLLGLDVEEEAFNGNRRVPFLVKIEGEILDIGRCDGAVSIVEVHEDITDRTVPKTTLSNG